ncbi:hypothetical protein [Bradyrhizobium genosp. P]|uniref:hypothetical protein n=1 Tax=Bradyrhizobium genosp. P TaxID=83641 RepID=UPI003CE7057F
MERFAMKAIEQIIAGYVFLKDRQSLEDIRDHRQRLLSEIRLHSFSGFNPAAVNETLQEELDLVEAALVDLESAQLPRSFGSTNLKP